MPRALPILLAASLLAFAEDPPPADDTGAKVMERVNVFRKLAGLTPVTLDAALSKGCASHAAYLLENQENPATRGLGAHNEDPKLPGYTKEGEEAGRSADIHYIEPVRAVDGWMASLFHRTPLLEPSLAKIGFGAVENGERGWFVVVDVMGGKGGGKKPAGKGVQPVVYPKDKQKDVPLAFGGEVPDPIPEDRDDHAGYPITAQFPPGVPVKEASVGLKDAEGKLIECWISTPDKPADARYQRNTVCAISKDVLKPGVTYTVNMAAKVGGRPWAAEWKFTTEGEAEKPPAPPK
ncbi:MAG: hypothetical protein FD180_3123 [Planctomycetota bacterium]|nr:MAG: hypothetical protein FD180_3123 [Planctomycetota bacterium]